MNINISTSNSRTGYVFSPLVLISTCFDACLSAKLNLSTIGFLFLSFQKFKTNLPRNLPDFFDIFDLVFKIVGLPRLFLFSNSLEFPIPVFLFLVAESIGYRERPQSRLEGT